MGNIKLLAIIIVGITACLLGLSLILMTISGVAVGVGTISIPFTGISVHVSKTMQDWAWLLGLPIAAFGMFMMSKLQE